MHVKCTHTHPHSNVQGWIFLNLFFFGILSATSLECSLSPGRERKARSKPLFLSWCMSWTNSEKSLPSTGSIKLATTHTHTHTVNPTTESISTVVKFVWVGQTVIFNWTIFQQMLKISCTIILIILWISLWTDTFIVNYIFPVKS